MRRGGERKKVWIKRVRKGGKKGERQERMWNEGGKSEKRRKMDSVRYKSQELIFLFYL